MTLATPTLTSPWAGDPGTKFGIAIGRAWVPPGTTSSRCRACANHAVGRTIPDNARAPPASVKARREISDDRPDVGLSRNGRNILIDLVMKQERQRLPFRIFRGRKHGVWLTSDNGPTGSFKDRALAIVARLGLQQRRGCKRATLFECQCNGNFEVLFVEPTAIRLPAIMDPADERGKITCR